MTEDGLELTILELQACKNTPSSLKPVNSKVKEWQPSPQGKDETCHLKLGNITYEDHLSPLWSPFCHDSEISSAFLISHKWNYSRANPRPLS